LRAELELEGHVTPEQDKHARLVLADVIEKEFAKCTHAPAESMRALWCHVCGSGRAAVGALWRRPHWRDVILRALLAGVLLLVVSCGGRVLDVGSTSAVAPPRDAGAAERYCLLYVPQPIDTCLEVGTCEVLETNIACDDPFVITENHWACCPSACAWEWRAWPGLGCSSVGNRGARVDAGGASADGG
jgi:hypothetical protein